MLWSLLLLARYLCVTHQLTVKPHACLLPPVSLAGDVDQAVRVTTELAHRPGLSLTEGAPVPDLGDRYYYSVT